MAEYPDWAHRFATHGSGRCRQTRSSANVGEQREGRCEGNQKPETQVLRDPKGGTQAFLRALRSLVIHKSVEKHLFGEEYHGQGREARCQAELETR
jgi:hypothetical protein